MAAAFWCGERPVLAASGDPNKGKALYEQLCASCHGGQGKGDGPAGQALVPPAADLTAPASRRKSDAELRTIIEKGKPGTAMPGWRGRLSEQERQDVLAYVRSLGG